MKKLTIIIPTYNEAETIAQVLNEVLQTQLSVIKEIIVVDDGSTDRTTEIIECFKNKITYVQQKKNEGKGAAIAKGMKKVTGEMVIIQDADLEYHPADIQILLNEALRYECPVVYGSRNLKKNTRSNFLFYQGGKFITFITNLLFGSSLTDVNTGYKLINTSLMQSLLPWDSGFAFCETITAKILSQGIPIREVPISYKPRSRDEGKKITYRDGLRALLTLLFLKFSLKKTTIPK